MSPRPYALLAVVLLPVLTGCGAGLVSGIAASNSGRRGSPATPFLNVTNPSAPLEAPFEPTRTIAISNYRLAPGSDIRVELHALGVVSVQKTPVVLSATPTSASIIFVETHEEIRKLVPTAQRTVADVPAELVCYIDGVQVGQTAPFTLVKQRVATHAPLVPGAANTFVSVAGTDTFRLRVSGIAPGEDFKSENVRVEIGVVSVQAQSMVVTPTMIEPVAGSDDYYVTAVAPPNAYPDQLLTRVVDDVAGQSTLVTSVFYHPEISLVSPRVGSTLGGGTMAIFGEGLVPRPINQPIQFSDVRIVFAKGTGLSRREFEVPSSLIQQRSSAKQLVFPLPPSPDGRPGDTTVEVHVSSEDRFLLSQVEVSASTSFSYQRPSPGFGPRGALLTSRGQAMAFGRFEASAGAPDIALLSASGGLPSVELLLAEDNGMFSSFGAPLLAGNQSGASQTNPADICAGDFEGDGDLDLLIANQGSGGTAPGTHTVVVGQPSPLPPLVLSGITIPDMGRAAICRAADFDRDGVQDVVVLPEVATGRGPEVYLGRPSNPGGFALVSPGGDVSANAPYDAIGVGDLDGDANPDLVCVRGGLGMVLVTAFGDGAGGFGEQTAVPLSIPGYTPDDASVAIGVHLQPSPGLRPLTVVLGGVEGSSVTPPVVATLLPAGPGRRYDPVAAENTLLATGIKPWVASAAGDLDSTVLGDELVVAGADGSARMLRLMQWTGTSYQEVDQGVQLPLEPLQGIRSLAIGLAIPSAGAGSPLVSGLFVLHQTVTQSGLENRITTWLGAPGPALLAPDASVELPDPVRGQVLGNFTGRGGAATSRRRAADAMVGTPSGLQLLANDGAGTMMPGASVPVSGLIPTAMTALSLSATQSAMSVAVLLDDGRVGVLPPGASNLVYSGDLRQYASATAASWPVSSESRLVGGDVDSDGIDDLVVVLVLEDVALQEKETALLLLRGDPTAAPLLLHEPDGRGQAAIVADAASAVVLGDFLRTSPQRLELAMAIPDPGSGAGNHVRFYRYDDGGTPQPGDDRFVRSFAQASKTALIAGDRPTQLIAVNLDDNDAIDLAVASAGDSRLRVFRNSGQIDPNAPAEVNIAAFAEEAGATALPAGVPTGLFAGDINGDGVADLVATTAEDNSGMLDHHVAVYTNDGFGVLATLRILPSFRTGDTVLRGGSTPELRNAGMQVGFTDLNWDGVPDLLVGWDSAGTGDRNVRVLFGSAR